MLPVYVAALPNQPVSRSRAAPLRGTAGAPAAGLRVEDARPARARRRNARHRLISQAHPSCCQQQQHGPSSSLPIVQLAATASRPPWASLRDGFASLDPAPTRKDSAPTRKNGED